MASEHKTHAEIIADMLYKAGVICPWQVNGGTCELCPLGHSPHGKDLGKYCSFHKLAHELESAHKREIDEAERRANHAAIKNVSETLSKVGPLYDAESVGNAAKLHSAAEVTLTTIKKCMDILNSIPSDCGYDGLVEDVGDELCALRDDFINAALAAPARNCDVLTADERTHKFIEKWEKAHGESIDGKTIIHLSSFSRWLQHPCESEEAK